MRWHEYFPGITKKEVQAAADAAYDEYHRHMAAAAGQGRGDHRRRPVRRARRIIVLAGRPYHVDPEINHGIDQLICRQCGGRGVTEDSVSCYEQKFPTARAEPVDLPQPACTPPPSTVTEQPRYGPGAAGVLRLRRGRHHHR